MNPQIMAASLGTLGGTGSAYGVVLTHGQELRYQKVPFSKECLAELVATVDDIAFYFQQNGRNPDQLAFGYDGGNLLIAMRGALRLLVFHYHTEEVDSLANAARAFLKDFEMGDLLSGWSIQAAPRTATQRIPVQPARR